MFISDVNFMNLYSYPSQSFSSGQIRQLRRELKVEKVGFGGIK